MVFHGIPYHDIMQWFVKAGEGAALQLLVPRVFQYSPTWLPLLGGQHYTKIPHSQVPTLLSNKTKAVVGQAV